MVLPAARPPRVDIRKTYRLFIGGASPLGVGPAYPAAGPDGAVLAHVAIASRKDARDAVVAARKAVAGWAGATAYNRGQVLTGSPNCSRAGQRSSPRNPSE